MIHGISRLRITFLAAAIFIMLITLRSAAEAATQTFTLRPGWNAIFLEVQPDVKDPASVFRELPVESVWTWFDRGTSVEFIRNPSEGLWAQPGWNVYVKSTDPAKSALTNLHAIFANRAYLIKLGGRQAYTWTISGIPVAAAVTWTPNSYNLLGFKVNPAGPPTFANFFAPSAAHKGQAIYRLSDEGVWTLVTSPAATQVRSGEAYWVYCSGSSTYQGPLGLTVGGNALNYGLAGTMKTITISNQTTLSRTVTLKLLPQAAWMTYQSFNASTGYFEYPLLSGMPPIVLPAGKQANVWIAVSRAAVPSGLTQAVLEVSDNYGSRYLVPVSVEKLAQ